MRYGELQVVDVYSTPADISRFSAAVAAYRVKPGEKFCKADACPFVPGTDFHYDTASTLYYRARAITADITNQNGDLFEHDQIKEAYKTFIGKGIYFNHDSADPDKAFGIILDAMYTPELYGDDTYEDKYVEILGAIDREAIRAKRPGLLEDIESGKVTSTSMGTIAKQARCSVCNNLAFNMETLCEHVHPQSPLYMKGRNVFGKMCYETNYGLTFIEDSIVYVPADPTAHMLEVYASKNSCDGHFNRLADVFQKYSRAAGRKVSDNPIELTSNFKNTGGVTMEKQAATSPVQHTRAPDQHLVQPYQETVKDLPEEVKDSTAKTLDNKIRRIIDELLRKHMAPLLEAIDKSLRPTIEKQIVDEVAKVKVDVTAVLPDVQNTLATKPAPKPGEPGKEEGPAKEAPKAEEKPAEKAPALAPAAASVRTTPITYVENFAYWNETDKLKLIAAINANGPYEFNGELELPVEPAPEGK